MSILSIRVDWDKNSSSQGDSYLHLLNEVATYIDLYCIVRKNKLAKILEDRLMAGTTLLFLNSTGSQFGFLNLKHISDSIGIDVTSYKFRRIICTWALSHSNQLVRDAEAPALNHRPDVAEGVYRENRAIKPQLLVQQYNKEEAVISSKMKEDLQHLDPNVKKLIEDMHAEQDVRRRTEIVGERTNRELKLSSRNPALMS